MLQGEQCCTLGSPRGSMLGSIPGMLRVGGRDPELGCFAKQNPTLHGARGLWGGDSGPAAPPWGCRARTSPPSRSTGVRGSCLLALLWLSSRPWPAASRAGTVCTVRAEPSLSSRRGLIFSLIWQGLGRGGGAGRASSPSARKQPRRIPALLFIKAGDLCTSPLASPRPGWSSALRGRLVFPVSLPHTQADD